MPRAGFYNQLDDLKPPISPAILKKKNKNKKNATSPDGPSHSCVLNRFFETRIRSCGDTITGPPLTLRISSHVLDAGVQADVGVDIAHTNVDHAKCSVIADRLVAINEDQIISFALGNWISAQGI